MSNFTRSVDADPANLVRSALMAFNAAAWHELFALTDRDSLEHCRADGTSPGACAQEASRKGPSVLAYISAAEYEQRLQAEQTRCPLNRGKLGNRLRNRVIA